MLHFKFNWKKIKAKENAKLYYYSVPEIPNIEPISPIIDYVTTFISAHLPSPTLSWNTIFYADGYLGMLCHISSPTVASIIPVEVGSLENPSPYIILWEKWSSRCTATLRAKRMEMLCCRSFFLFPVSLLIFPDIKMEAKWSGWLYYVFIVKMSTVDEIIVPYYHRLSEY